MNHNEIKDEAQKYEDALKKNDTGEIAKMLVTDSLCKSPEDMKQIMDEWKSINSHDRAANAGLPSMELAVGIALYDSMSPPVEEKDQSGAISAGDNAAGQVNNTTVVSEADISSLKGALGSIDGGTAEGQYAIARVTAALNAAEAKLAAGRSSGVGGDWQVAQQFGSPQAYEAWLKEQALKKAPENPGK